MRVGTLLWLGMWLAGFAPIAWGQTASSEPPILRERVASGELAPAYQRLPDNPFVVYKNGYSRLPGEYGGDLRMLMAKAKDIRMMTIYGYARLVGFDEQLELVPDILEDLEVDRDRVFTLRLRTNHRWSDGHPFTAEDFRYYWEDVAMNEELSPYGQPRELLVDGEPPVFEVLDEHTVRYTWSAPNPFFVPALAGTRPLYIYRPAHYLKRFHARYTEAEELERTVKKHSARNWAALHNLSDNLYKSDNPGLPTLQPWQNTTEPPADRFVFVRNPFFHRVDWLGRQLPYLDRVLINLSDNKLIPAKTGAGEVDLQARYLRFDNFTFLKAGEKRNRYSIKLWRTVKGSQLALYPNLNAEDPEWRRLMRDARFRRALSLGVNRHEINQVVYYGLVIEGGNSVIEGGPLYRPEYQQAWAQFDLEQANALLDEIGLTQRERSGVRLLPDGRPMDLIIETAGESTEETDVLELIRDSWSKLGIRSFTRPSQREVFRNRIFSGQTVMSIWSGLENAVPTADMSPAELAPTTQQQLQWPRWGQYYETNGTAGEPPDVPEVMRLAELNKAWRFADSHEERSRIWHEMLAIHADQVFTIGTVTGVLQPVVVSDDLHNVPDDGVYNWEPGAYFGIYRPDTFWLARSRR